MVPRLVCALLTGPRHRPGTDQPEPLRQAATRAARRLLAARGAAYPFGGAVSQCPQQPECRQRLSCDDVRRTGSPTHGSQGSPGSTRSGPETTLQPINGLLFNPMSSIVGLLCPILGFAIVVFIIVIIVRTVARAGAGGGGGIQPSLPNVVTQLGQDGFWIVSWPAGPWGMVHYRLWMGGVKHSGQVPFQPGADGRQFVYTGARPEQVSIVRILQVSENVQPDIIPPILGAAATIWASSSDDRPDVSSAPPSPPSFPSAY